MPANARTRQILGLMADAVKASDAGDHAAAARAWRRCIVLDDGTDAEVMGTPDLPPFRLRPYLTYANYLRERGDAAHAIRLLAHPAVRWPDDADLHLVLGHCYEQVKDWARAAAALQRSNELQPDASVCVLIARALRRLHRRADALQWLRHALEIDPRYEEAHFNLGCACEADGDVDGAIAHLARAIELDADYALAHARLGPILFRRAMRAHPDDRAHPDWLGAHDHLSRAIALDPRDGWSHMHLAILCGAQAQHAEAEAHHQAATRLMPTICITWAYYGNFLSRRGDTVEAERLLRHAVALDPDEPDPHYWLGTHLWRTDHRADARTELRLAHRLGHRRARAWLRDHDG